MQAEVTVGGLQSFPLDESSVYNYHSSHHHPPQQHNHSNGTQQQSPASTASPSPAASSAANHKSAAGGVVHAEASKESLSNVSSPSRSHRRMASAPHVPKRTVSKLTSMENNVNLNNNSTNVKQHQSPSRRVINTPVTSQGM